MRINCFIFILLLSGCNSNDSPGKISPPKPASKSWLGKWERQIWQNDGDLEISAIKSDSIRFYLSAYSGAHTGEIEGLAIVKDSMAIYSNTDEPDSCLIEFKLLGDSVIAINQRNGICATGLAVTYTGNYKNKKLLPKVEKDETMLSLGIFKTGEQDSLFKSLVGEKYSSFVNSTQLTSEDEDLDSLHTTVYSSGVRGLFTFMENIIMTDSSDNIWAAVIDDEKVYYFTNKEEYKEKLPKTIEAWRERFKKYEVIYK